MTTLPFIIPGILLLGSLAIWAYSAYQDRRIQQEIDKLNSIPAPPAEN